MENCKSENQQMTQKYLLSSGKNNKSESELKQNRKTIDHKLCAVFQTYFNNFLRKNSQVTFKIK